MTTLPLVSVVIPAYNAARYIDAALRSVVEQTYANIEIIVVNDGSSDATAETVRAWEPRVTCVDLKNSGGYPGVPRNAGIALSSGTFVSFLDADDIMIPDRIEAQVAFLLAHQTAGLVFSDFQLFSAQGNGKRHFPTCVRLQTIVADQDSWLLTSAEATELLLRENFGAGGMFTVRRELLERLGGFPKTMRIGEDFFLYYKAASVCDMGVINRIGTLKRAHADNVTNDSLRYLRDYIVCRRALRDTEHRTNNLAVLNDSLSRAENNLACVYADQGNLRQSISHSWRALTDYPPRSVARLRVGLRTLARTAAIATGLKSRPA